MREEIANLVHPVLSYGLRLKERLERGESPDFDAEQSALKGLLLGELESRRYADFGGEGQGHDPLVSARGGSATRRNPDQFLGIRYALTCWLDEVFILDSPWGAKWDEHKIETALYGSNDRAWNFWEQAQLAEARPGIDPLEVMYLCVMLGFRGDFRDRPERLSGWAEKTGKRIAREQGKEWPMPPELDPPVNVPPLHGRERLQRMVMAVALFALLLVPVMAFVVFFKIMQVD
jgi:type VI secretion system protein ImpK